MTIYGYVRRKQPLPTNDQLKIVKDYSCHKIFIERADYRCTSELTHLVARLQPEDTVVIASLQVFGPSEVEAVAVLTRLRKKQVQVISWSTQLHLNYYKRTAGLL